MRRLLLFLAFVLVPVLASAQGEAIRYYPRTFDGGTITAPLLLADGTAAAPAIARSAQTSQGIWFAGSSTLFTVAGTTRFSMSDTGGFVIHTALPLAFGSPEGFTGDVILVRDAANILALRNGTNAQTFHVYNSFTTAGSNYGRFSISATATGTDLIGNGVGATAATGAFRSLQGSVAKSLTDAAAAVSFVRISVPTNANMGGKLIYTAASTDGANGSLTSTAEYNFSGADLAGTVTCGISAQLGVATAYSRANTLVCTVTTVTSTTNCDLQVTCTDNKAAAQTVTFNWRLDMPIPNTVTPQ